MTDDRPAVPYTLRDLARMTRDVLDLQREYFRAAGPRKLELIDRCKEAERRLRKVCDLILDPPPVAVPRLFGPEE